MSSRIAKVIAFAVAASGLIATTGVIQIGRAATGSLVAAYAFNESAGVTLHDSSGNGNDGTIANGTWTSQGKFGGALVFNGSSARVNVPNSASLQLSSGMTLEAWVDPASVSSGWRDVIYEGTDNYYLEGTSDHAGVPAGGGTFGGANANAFAPGALATNSWSYLAATYDGSTLRLYVNGTLVASQAKTGPITTSSNQLQIGGDSIYGQYFNGKIDQVRIYNTPLSAAQIQTDMNTPIGGSPVDTQPPSMSTGLATSGVTQTAITLSWNSSSDNVGVTGYRLYLNGSQVGTSLTISYLFSGLGCGTSYTLGVAAVDAANNVSGIATVSQQTAACPDTQPPSAPGTVSAHAASASEIDLSWGAASDNVGVTGYQVFRCQGSGCTSFAQVGTATGTTFSDTGLSAAASYSYQVHAVDAAGNQGAFSNAASATTLSRSAGLVAAYSFDEGSGVTLHDSSGNGNDGTIANGTWTSQGKFGGALVFNGSSARVNVPNSASLQLSSGMTLEAWVDPASVSSGWRDVIYKGTDNYYLEGTSDRSGAPAAHVTVAKSKAYAYGAGALATNSWSYLAATYDGSTLRLYVNGTLVASQAKTGPITTSSNQLQIGGDSIYGQYFNGKIDQVRIYNTPLSAAQIQTDMNTAVGGGSPDTTAPSTPSGLGVSSAGQTSLALSWSGSSDNVGVAGYGVYKNGSLVASPTGVGYSLTGLSCGTSYTVAVDAFDAAGNRSAKATITTSTAACPDTQAPGVPGGLVASFVTQSAVTLSWSVSSDNVGVVGYDLLLGGLVVGTSVQTSYAFSGLSCNTAYTLGVDAFDAAGNRSAVASLIVTTNACADTSPPSAPANLVESAATSSSITAGWSASSDNVAVTGYRVFVDGSQAGTTAATSYTVTGLSCGSSHQVVVDAYDAAGNRSPQTSATMATSSCAAPPPGDTTSPTTPTGLGVSSAGQTSLALAWNASSDNVGVAGYGVYKNGTLAASSTGTSYTLTGLLCGTSYSVAVDAYDAAGNRSAKATITTSTAACPDGQAPTVPSGVTLATRTATSISISWTASTDNVGVAGYDLYRAGSAVGTATATSYTFTGLACNTNYTLAVDAYDAAGNKSAQATTAIATSACPDTTPPSTPTGLATSAVGQTSLTLSWTASSDNVGVTGYRLYLNGTQVGTSSGTNYTYSGLACGTSSTLGVAAVDGAGNVSGTATLSAATAACSGSGGSSNWAGTFDCYGSTPNCPVQSPASCTSTISSGLQTALNNASGGNVICLNAGSYGNISLSSKSYSSDVIVQPASNAAATIGGVTLDAVAHLHITGIGGGSATLSMGFVQIDLNSGCSSNLTFDHYTSTGGANIIPKYSCSHGMTILFDHDRFDNLGQNTWEGRINVQGLDTAPTSNDGVTISNSHFGGAGGATQCSDGIDILGNAAGTVIGPGNEFTGIDQGYADSHCGGTHVDPIQSYGGGAHTTVIGNYFHDNGSGTGGIAGFASGDTPQITVTNNVFGGTVYTGQNAWLSGDGDVVTHNSFVDTGGGGGTGDLRIYNAGATSTVTNNMFAVNNWVLDSGCCTLSYNVNGSGTGNVNGTPVYVSSPSSGYYHYQLASNSPGYHAASDGKSMGITP